MSPALKRSRGPPEKKLSHECRAKIIGKFKGRRSKRKLSLFQKSRPLFRYSEHRQKQIFAGKNPLAFEKLKPDVCCRCCSLTCKRIAVHSPARHLRPALPLERGEAPEALVEDALMEALGARALRPHPGGRREGRGRRGATGPEEP